MVIYMNRIKELRAERKMKQDDLAAALHISRQAVSTYETETRQMDASTIQAFCAIFNCTADYLLGFSSRRSPEISPEDTELLAAYHAAPEEIRDIVDGALARYKGEKITAAG